MGMKALVAASLLLPLLLNGAVAAEVPRPGPRGPSPGRGQGLHPPMAPELFTLVVTEAQRFSERGWEAMSPNATPQLAD